MYRIVAVDLDGTVVPQGKSITPRAKDALRRAYNAGAHIVVSTARPYCSAEEVMRELSLPELPVICFAGSVLQMYPSKEVLYCDTFQPEHIRQIAAFCTSIGEHLQVYRLDGSYYFARRNMVSDAYANYFGYDGIETDFSQWSFTDACRSTVIVPDEPKERPVRAYAAIREALGKNYAVSCSWPGFFDIQPQGSSKGHTLSVLADRLGIPRGEIIAFGDQTVDRSMLEYAGIGVAMENGDEELKRTADLVAPPCEEDGVAEVLDRLLFGK